MIAFNSEMEAVASGSLGQLEEWGQLLLSSRITCEVRRFCDEHKEPRADRAELWVFEKDVDRARRIIRQATHKDSSLMW